jgi:hypothetical protein
VRGTAWHPSSRNCANFHERVPDLRRFTKKRATKRAFPLIFDSASPYFHAPGNRSVTAIRHAASEPFPRHSALRTKATAPGVARYGGGVNAPRGTTRAHAVRRGGRLWGAGPRLRAGPGGVGTARAWITIGPHGLGASFGQLEPGGFLIGDGSGAVEGLGARTPCMHAVAEFAKHIRIVIADDHAVVRAADRQRCRQ